MSGHPTFDQQLRQALTRQWTQVLPVLTAFVMSSVRDRQHAEDIVQEVGAAVSAHFEDIPEGVSFSAWALAIARNHIHKRYRSDQRDKHLFKSEALEALAGAYERLSDSSDDMRAALDQCVEELPERSRKIIELRYKQDQRVDGIAAMLGSSANAISGVLFRVRQSLKGCIEKRIAGGGK
ncbi:MAG: sigma-70 family RNA polymerase sigma factor [Phycisphaeraceae bacterium]|nr:sigma-70 family RNA polymerase sigma factor [Phycisphaeraceae bacterium]